MATMYYRPYTSEPVLDGSQQQFPSHHAVDSVLPEYQYIFMDQPNVPSDPATMVPTKTAAPAAGKAPDLDKTQYTLLDHQMKELDRYRKAVQKMGHDILGLRQQVCELEISGSNARRQLSKYNDASRFMLDSSELDGLSKPELASRYVSLKQTMSSHSSELENYKQRVQTLQNELIKKNEKEKEYLKMSTAHITQQDLVQKLQEHIQKEKDMKKTFKKQEQVIDAFERASKKKATTAESKKQGLMKENERLHSEVADLKKVKEKIKTAVPSNDDHAEKLELYQMLEKLDGRIVSLEKQLGENTRKWAREKMELTNRIRETDLGLNPTSSHHSLDNYPAWTNRNKSKLHSSSKLKPLVY